ncbi:hypothetical protein T484DRAFT_2389464, partial [Baffinella frigidus]
SGLFSQPSGLFSQPSGLFSQPSGLFSQPLAIHNTPNDFHNSHPPQKHLPPMQAPMQDPMEALPAPAQPKSLKNIPVIRPPVFDLNTPENIQIADEYAKVNGFVLVWVHKNKEEATAFARETVLEVWTSIVEDLALRPDLLARLISGGFTITDDESLDKFMGPLPRAFFRELYAILGKNIYLHSGFGAPASNRSFNLRVLWKLRQNTMLDAFAQRFLGTKDVKCSLDRPICKFHGKGDQEFLHLDKQPFSEPILDMISGKYCVSESSFICVPGSNNWNQEIKTHYQEFYKKKKSAKWGLDPNKPDRLNLFEKTRKLIVPANCMVMWMQDTIHGVVKNTTGRIAFGLYVGFSKEVERAQYEQVHNTPEVQDRFRVYSKGVAPKGFPSCDKTQLYPLRFQNFHTRIGDFTDKMDKTAGQYGFTRRKLNNRDEWVPHLVEYPPIDYTPPELSKRGKELLVGKRRVREFFGDDE